MKYLSAGAHPTSRAEEQRRSYPVASLLYCYPSHCELRERIKSKNWNETELDTVPDMPRRNVIGLFRLIIGCDYLGEHLYHRVQGREVNRCRESLKGEAHKTRLAADRK
ncbi:hypothetical protein CEXT_190301 [Caerostris extrusa]|uniref:Uncharacterized protein n=1 Tax=Caerostris extrusa TaxID=172846 RepID=A0AAV4RFX0_CAEEX|nr:hypothetical protein CEXT_190301 [Caerostris extrusa]